MIDKETIQKLKERRYPFKNSEGKWGYTDIFGKVVVPAQFDEIEESRYNVKGARELDKLPVMTYREWINKYTDYGLGENDKVENIEHLEECVYDRENAEPELRILGQANESLYLYRKDYGEEYISYIGVVRYGIMNGERETIGDCKYLNIFPFSEGLARVRIDIGGCSYLYRLLDCLQDTRGLSQSFYPSIEMLETELDSDMRIKYEYEFEDEGAEVYGFINTQGEIVIPVLYINASDFHEGLAAVERPGWGYINQQNEEVIPFVFDWADPFEDGYARVLFAGVYYIIDKEGLCYESFEELETGNGSKFYL